MLGLEIDRMGLALRTDFFEVWTIRPLERRFCFFGANFDDDLDGGMNFDAILVEFGFVEIAWSDLCIDGEVCFFAPWMKLRLV